MRFRRGPATVIGEADGELATGCRMRLGRRRRWSREPGDPLRPQSQQPSWKGVALMHHRPVLSRQRDAVRDSALLTATGASGAATTPSSARRRRRSEGHGADRGSDNGRSWRHRVHTTRRLAHPRGRAEGRVLRSERRRCAAESPPGAAGAAQWESKLRDYDLTQILGDTEGGYEGLLGHARQQRRRHRPGRAGSSSAQR